MMVGWYAVYPRHGRGSLIDLTVAVVESRCFGEAQDANGEDSGGYEGETQGDLPGCGFTRLVAFGSVIENCGEEDTECDEELVGGN
jgi:hypothetical protein